VILLFLSTSETVLRLTEKSLEECTKGNAVNLSNSTYKDSRPFR